MPSRQGYGLLRREGPLDLTWSSLQHCRHLFRAWNALPWLTLAAGLSNAAKAGPATALGQAPQRVSTHRGRFLPISSSAQIFLVWSRKGKHPARFQVRALCGSGETRTRSTTLLHDDKSVTCPLIIGDIPNHIPAIHMLCCVVGDSAARVASNRNQVRRSAHSHRVADIRGPLIWHRAESARLGVAARQKRPNGTPNGQPNGQPPPSHPVWRASPART